MCSHAVDRRNAFMHKKVISKLYMNLRQEHNQHKHTVLWIFTVINRGFQKYGSWCDITCSKIPAVDDGSSI